MLDGALAYWQTNRQRQLSELIHFLSIPSISTLKQHRADVALAAQHVADKLHGLGFESVEVIAGKEELDEHPLVKAEWMKAPGKPTILLYAHYDVQPVDPLNKWVSPPFEPQVREGKLFARGAADDKGQLWILVEALAGFLSTNGELPLNVKVLFEGEEEANGTHIERFVEDNPDWLAVDSVLVLDQGMFTPGLPTITTALRGLVCAEIAVRGAKEDLHSGEHGGAAPNAVQALAEIVAGLKTKRGKVRIPGFYRGVTKPSQSEVASWAALPFDEAEYCRHELGVAGLIGDRRYSVLHRRWALPTLEVHGIGGGFTGDGFKTVIPSEATAKVSMRMVPGMDPNAVAAAFKAYVERIAPEQVQVEVRILSASPALCVETSAKAVTCAAEAYRQTFGTETAYVRDGGSIPVAGTFKRVLGVPVLLTGFTLPDCNMHAPNENLDLGNFYQGIEAIGRYFYLLGLNKQ